MVYVFFLKAAPNCFWATILGYTIWNEYTFYVQQSLVVVKRLLEIKSFFSLKMCPTRLQSGKCHNTQSFRACF